MLVLVLSSLFSFDHRNGPKYLIECFPYVIRVKSRDLEVSIPEEMSFIVTTKQVLYV